MFVTEPWLVRFKITQQPEPAEVTILGRAEEWGCPWVSRAEVVSEGCQHGDETVALICQREGT